jgi:hypothetical protein
MKIVFKDISIPEDKILEHLLLKVHELSIYQRVQSKFILGLVAELQQIPNFDTSKHSEIAFEKLLKKEIDLYLTEWTDLQVNWNDES